MGLRKEEIPGVVFLYHNMRRKCSSAPAESNPRKRGWAFPSGKRGGTIMTEEILSVLNGEVFGVWFLIGAALVFWMQAGFAMVETGFTRAKNAGNILMKNLI